MNANTSETMIIERQLREFLGSIDALMMATVDDDGMPEASYAPYIEHDDCFYVFVSTLAAHTGNLQGAGKASVLFMEPGPDGHAHTRKRLSCRCNATRIARDEALFDDVLQRMEARFGKLIATLRGLGDFQLFQLTPQSGNFVASFGQAFELDFPLGSGSRLKSPD